MKGARDLDVVTPTYAFDSSLACSAVHTLHPNMMTQQGNVDMITHKQHKRLTHFQHAMLYAHPELQCEDALGFGHDYAEAT